jgi:hypothetical protein
LDLARKAVLVCALAAVCPALAAQGPIRAVRISEVPKLDGVPDEALWQRAPPYTDFVEQFPGEGRVPPPAFQTEVRVVFDDRTLYVSVVCRDPRPDEINRQLARRDAVLSGDQVELAIDSAHEGRNGYYFAVNAAGVLRDGLLYGDVNLADTWDGVWDAAVALRPDGWSAEFAIPLDLLRFPRAPTQAWGFLVRRTVYRTHQVFDSRLIPRSANGLVSQLGTLTGLDGLQPRRAFQITPYATARLSLRPQFSDPAYPQPRLTYPSADVGADLRATLTSDLTLVAAINPDFGQVEADQVILNLSNQEIFFPEKRPFFNQGLELFQPVGAEFGVPQRLFYSRRIGLDTPILGAAKVTGNLRKGLELGLLDAVVLGVADPGKHDVAYLDDPDPDDAWVHQVEQTPDRRLGLHSQRPLHLGLNGELPREPPVPRNYLAAALRQSFLGSSAVGGTFTSVNPLASRCTEADIRQQQERQAALPEAIRVNSADPIAPEDCQAYGGTTAGLDLDLRSRNGEWLAVAAINGSRRIGGPASDVLFDGTVMHPGDLGLGGYFIAGRLGGEGVRANVSYQGASPRLDLNAMGFQESQNRHAFGGNLRYFRSRGIGSLREIQANLAFQSFWTADGRWTPRGNYGFLDGWVTLPGFQVLGGFVALNVPRFDVREIRRYGVPLQRQNTASFTVYGNTDPNRPVVLSGNVYVLRSFRQDPIPAQTGWGTELNLLLRPWPWWETQLSGKYDRQPQGARYVDCWMGPCSKSGLETKEHNTLVFGRQDAEDLSITLRQTFIFAPRLTLQIYAQLFSAGAHYPELFSASASAGERIEVAQLQKLSSRPEGIDNPDFHDAALNVNVVLRWEYRLGSTLYLVYARNQSALGLSKTIDPVTGAVVKQQEPTSGLTPLRLGPGPTVDTFQVKWSYFFDL